MKEDSTWLYDVVHAYLLDDLTKQQKEELSAWLREGKGNQELFLETLEVEYTLHGGLTAGTSSLSEYYNVDDPSATERKSKRSRWLLAGSVLPLLGCLLLGLLFWRSVQNPRGLGSVARLSQVTEAVFSQSHQLPREQGSFLGKGWVQLESGTVEITFHSKVKVVLTGPANFGIDSTSRAFLDFGAVDVDVPESAGNFVIGTANMEVVDLGTKFQVRVDPDTKEADVEVSEGLVDLHLGNQDSGSRIETLLAGQEAALDPRGDVLAISGTPTDEQPPSFLFAHWKMDQITVDREILDASGKRRHGIFKHDTFNVLTEGKDGQALDLSDGGYIDISDQIPELTPLNAFTFTAWVRNPDNVLFSLSNAPRKSRVNVQIHKYRFIYGYAEEEGWDVVRKIGMRWEKDRWYHVAVSVSGSKVAMYRDGVLLYKKSHGERIRTKAMGLADVEGPTCAMIGHLPTAARRKAQQFSGQIDDVQMYSRALDSKAIEYLHAHPGEPLRTGYEE